MPVSLNIIFLILITIVCAYAVALVWRGQQSWDNVSLSTVYVLPNLLGKCLYPLRHFASSPGCIFHHWILPFSMSLSKRHDGQIRGGGQLYSFLKMGTEGVELGWG